LRRFLALCARGFGFVGVVDFVGFIGFVRLVGFAVFLVEAVLLVANFNYSLPLFVRTLSLTVPIERWNSFHCSMWLTRRTC